MYKNFICNNIIFDLKDFIHLFIIIFVVIVFVFKSFVIIEIFICCIIFIYYTSFLSFFVIAYSCYYCHCLFSFSSSFVINHMSISQLKRLSWLKASFHKITEFMYFYKFEKADKISSFSSVHLLYFLIVTLLYIHFAD